VTKDRKKDQLGQRKNSRKQTNFWVKGRSFSQNSAHKRRKAESRTVAPGCRSVRLREEKQSAVLVGHGKARNVDEQESKKGKKKKKINQHQTGGLLNTFAEVVAAAE